MPITKDEERLKKAHPFKVLGISMGIIISVVFLFEGWWESFVSPDDGVVNFTTWIVFIGMVWCGIGWITYYSIAYDAPKETED